MSSDLCNMISGRMVWWWQRLTFQFFFLAKFTVIEINTRSFRVIFSFGDVKPAILTNRFGDIFPAIRTNTIVVSGILTWISERMISGYKLGYPDKWFRGYKGGYPDKLFRDVNPDIRTNS